MSYIPGGHAIVVSATATVGCAKETTHAAAASIAVAAAMALILADRDAQNYPQEALKPNFQRPGKGADF